MGELLIKFIKCQTLLGGMVKKRDDVFIGLSALFLVVMVLALVPIFSDVDLQVGLWLGALVLFLFSVFLGYFALHPARAVDFELPPLLRKKRISKKQRAFWITFYRIFFTVLVMITLVFLILFLFTAIGVGVFS